ncbi:MAG: molecular chaperone DnaJ [Desulfobacterales bacterium]|nr:molecular chaperone DnaJ [Pseudomonadota bacterium]MCG2773257.1 molecular chaperone DnaJ [Desulfobacterales bacterium]
MANQKKDYYQVLGVPRDAGVDEVKKKYRQIALKYHPDRNPGNKTAEDKFKEAAEAYEVLHDPEKRRLYDTYGHEGLSSTGFTGFSDFSDIFRSFSDIFGDVFGFAGGFGGGGGARPQAGNDLRYDLTLDFLDAALGSEVTVEVPRVVTCRTCSGSGAKPGTKRTPCPQCGGRGVVSRSHGIFQITTTCPRCQGMKEFVAEVCSGCNGEGRIREKKKLKVKIPPGMDSGTHLVMPGEGNGGAHGGPPGDLYIVMNVRPHDFFQREGYDLHLQVPISFVQAALGTRFTIPTLKASHELVIPPGTQPGEVIRLKGEGVPYPKGQRRGDLLVEVRVVIPRDLNARQQHLLNELAKEEPEPHTQPAGSSEHDEGLLKKLWNTITDSIGDRKQEHRKD